MFLLLQAIFQSIKIQLLKNLCLIVPWHCEIAIIRVGSRGVSRGNQSREECGKWFLAATSNVFWIFVVYSWHRFEPTNYILCILNQLYDKFIYTVSRDGFHGSLFTRVSSVVHCCRRNYQDASRIGASRCWCLQNAWVFITLPFLDPKTKRNCISSFMCGAIFLKKKSNYIQSKVKT